MNKTTLKSSFDELNLAVAYIEPVDAPRGTVQIVHGMCEHKERYYPLMRYLASNGYVCVIHDNRGHGGSVKDRADLGFMYRGGWQALVEDIETVRRWSEKQWPGLEKTLLGHSMGSLAVRSYVKRHDMEIDRLIVIGSPNYRCGTKLGKAIAGTIGTLFGGRHRSHLLQKMCFGSFNRPFKKDGYASSWICSEKKVLEEYHSDPLCNFTFTANGFRNLLGLMVDCYSVDGWKAGNIDLPVYFLSGKNDPCLISEKAMDESIRKMHRLGYYTVECEMFDGMRHEILNENGNQKVWNRLLDILSTSPENAFWLS